MFKSQLESPPESYETTAIFVENIFDTVKKAKAAKAAAAKSVEPSYDFSFGNLSPVKKKKPRKNAKKNVKTKKPTTPKKKLTLRKSKASKETPDKRKKASPTKSPRKYTKRQVPKVPAAADIDDEEAAFILSSISQRSFDSFYSRLNSSETNKIHIPIDISTHSPCKTLSTRNDQAYYVMLDHNYWIVEPEVPPAAETAKAELAVLDVPAKIDSEVQIHFKIQHSEAKNLSNEPQQNAHECCETTTSSVLHVHDKVMEVNNNKFPITSDAAPFEQKTIKNESTAVKKRWLRQAATEMKSPPKKRKKENLEAIEVKPDVVNGYTFGHEKNEEIEHELPVKVKAEQETIACKRKVYAENEINLKPETSSIVARTDESLIEAPRKRIIKASAPDVNFLQATVQTLIDASVQSSIKGSAPPLIEVPEKLKIEAPAQAPTAFLIKTPEKLLGKPSVNPLTETPAKLLIEAPVKLLLEASETLLFEDPSELNEDPAKLLPATSVEYLKIETDVIKEDFVETKASILDELTFTKQPIKIEAQTEISTEKVKDEPMIDIRAENIIEAVTNNTTFDCEQISSSTCDEENDELDEKRWEKVMEFHRLQLQELQQKNGRFSASAYETSMLARTERTSPEQSIRNYDAKLGTTNRLPRVHTRFSLFENSEYIDPRKALRTSLSMEKHQDTNNVGPAPFQRSTSDISLSEVRRNRWSGNSSASTPFNSNSTLPFTSFYAESHHFDRDESYSKTCYSAYRTQKSSWLNNQTPDSHSTSWEIQTPNSFAASYSSIKETAMSVFKSEENLGLLQNISSTTPNILLTKTKTSSCDPRLNPTLVQEVRKEENSAPKKKVRPRFHYT